MKYTHKELREMIKAQILQELDGGSTLREAKKKKKEEEAPEEEDAGAFAGTEEVGTEEVGIEDMGTEFAGGDGIDIGSPEMKKVSSTLTDAYKAAKELGDEKLIQQVANTIKYFNDNVLLGS